MASAAKKTRSEDAYLALKNEILTNKLAPGHHSTEPELALRLGVSRTTIREALIRLEADGLVQLIPRRGARVLPIRAEDMREIYEILTALESEMAAGLAARKLSETDLEPLIVATENMQTALEQNALEDWAKADETFHDALLALHGNSRLSGIVHVLSDQSHRARIATLRLRDIPQQSTREHQDILDALIAGAPDRARQAFRAHRQRASRELLDILEKLTHL